MRHLTCRTKLEDYIETRLELDWGDRDIRALSFGLREALEFLGCFDCDVSEYCYCQQILRAMGLEDKSE